MAEDQRVRAVIEDGTVRALRVDVREVAAQALALHGLDGFAAQLCTEAITCAALLAAYLDEGERLTLQIQASAPRFALTVDAAYDGSMRARFSPARVPETPRIQGVMLVLKSVVGREVYRGVSEVDHRTLEEMLQHHLDRSTQAPARVAVNGGLGVFVERLPGADGRSMGSDALGGLAGMLLATQLDGEAQPLHWACACSEERVLEMIAGLGPAEIRSMLEEDGGAKVTCHFCTRTVEVGADGLRSLL